MKPTHRSASDSFQCQEIEIHYKRPLFSAMPKVESAEEAMRLFRQYINPKRIDLKEFFWVMLCSRASNVLAIAEVASGTLSQVMIPIRELIQLALMTNAAGIICCHNHPSGKTGFSEADIHFTEKLTEACKLFNINLIDHLIITSESFASYQQDIGFE